MNEYLLRVKTLVDNLRYSGYILGPNDHVLYILFRLGSEFDPLVMTANAKANKVDVYTIEKVSSLLFAQEKGMEKIL